MSKIDVRTVKSEEDRSLPIFEEVEKVADQIRVRAYNLFRNRGFSEGRELDDWLTAEREICWPAAELVDEDDEFEIKIALAGFEPKDIEVTATPRELIVKASKRGKREKRDDNVRWSEFRSNEVFRRIALPADINVAKVEAEFEHGMLEIEAPKAAQSKRAKKPARPRKVKVKKSD